MIADPNKYVGFMITHGTIYGMQNGQQVKLRGMWSDIPSLEYALAVGMADGSITNYTFTPVLNISYN